MNNPYSPFLALIVGIGLFMLIVKLFKSKSEGARRLRFVLGIAGALGLIAILLTGFNPLEVVIIVAVISAVVWVIKGFTNRP